MAKKEGPATNPEFLDNLTEFLTEAPPEADPEELRDDLRRAGVDPDRVTARVKALVDQTPIPFKADPARAVNSVWRRVALMAAALLIVVLSTAAYRIAVLQKELAGKEASYQKLSAETERRNQTLQSEAAQARDLSKRIGEVLKENQEQAKKIAELAESLGKYVRPSTDAVLLIPFLRSREPEKVQEIARPKDKLFLNFQVRVSQEEDYQTYRLALKDRLGSILWQENQAKKDDLGNFNVLIGHDFLKPGEYVLEVYGAERGRQNLISQNRFRIR